MTFEERSEIQLARKSSLTHALGMSACHLSVSFCRQTSAAFGHVHSAQRLGAFFPLSTSVLATRDMVLFAGDQSRRTKSLVGLDFFSWFHFYECVA